MDRVIRNSAVVSLPGLNKHNIINEVEIPCKYFNSQYIAI